MHWNFVLTSLQVFDLTNLRKIPSSHPSVEALSAERARSGDVILDMLLLLSLGLHFLIYKTKSLD